MPSAVLIFFVFFHGFIILCDGQSIAVASNIYDSLPKLGCNQFLALINKAQLSSRFQYAQENYWTIIVWNDTAFENLPPARKNEMLSMTTEQNEAYITAFTLTRVLETTGFSEQRPEMSRSPYQTKVFFNIRSRREGDVASGTAGPTEYYANGALILRPNIPAGKSMIHVVDRVLELPSKYGVKGFISLPGQPDTAFYDNVVMFLPAEYWNDVVEPLNSNQRVTVFIPTKEAIDRIPSDKLQQLRGSSQLLRDVIKRHIIADQIMYTSFVYHNEGVNTLYGQLIYRISSKRETVFVSSGAVTAQVVQGNITAMNGVVHFIDTLLGYVYNTALDEIRLTSFATTFENVLIKSRNDLQNAIVLPNGITVFVPINQAFSNLPSMYNFHTNQSLINMVMELCMLQQGMEFQLTSVNGDYEARRTLLSRYFNRPVNVYSQGNETWVESGYVKAKVVRPDIGVTNGFIHFIDAVPGLPSKSIPDTIFCEDWLIKSHMELQITGLDVYLSDPLAKAVVPCANTGVNKYPASSQQQAASAPPSCGTIGERCSFTVFIPSGTAIDSFENQTYGKQIKTDTNKWQWVLRRHMTRQIIYIDQTALTQEREYTADNGDVVRYKRSTDRYAYLYFRGKQARILHSDLGATNGVVHIIDQVIFTEDDLPLDSFSPSSPTTSAVPNLTLNVNTSASPTLPPVPTGVPLFGLCPLTSAGAQIFALCPLPNLATNSTLSPLNSSSLMFGLCPISSETPMLALCPLTSINTASSPLRFTQNLTSSAALLIASPHLYVGYIFGLYLTHILQVFTFNKISK